jgi:hypothetical protein
MLRRLIVLAVVVASAAAVGLAWATIPSNDGTINACYGNLTGFVRIIDSASDKCRPWETPISWNQTGPAGPPGKGLVTMAWSDWVSVPAGEIRFASAVCPRGSVALGSAYHAEKWEDKVVVSESDPIGHPDGRSGWYLKVVNLGGTDANFIMRAICYYNVSWGAPQ